MITGFSKHSAAWFIGIDRGDRIIPAGQLKYGLNKPEGKAVFSILKKAVIHETEAAAYVEPFIRIGVRFRNWTRAGKMRLPVLENVILG
ncbi:hypothetical protein YDYSY3_38690 [Paenibacillus chitinolyticus]|uniref:hypothetical protein n=1 Tax=Paenibacillus chitinolyticus TaxID=79263 RepID=UPI0026E4D664|nr:hypothetical protein [Paenibacillus chitinolyticus]GKS12869.1 hypothetical protein YDYSY3_38690 [Paenibacillus chitinolyticus]